MEPSVAKTPKPASAEGSAAVATPAKTSKKHEPAPKIGSPISATQAAQARSKFLGINQTLKATDHSILRDTS